MYSDTLLKENVYTKENVYVRATFSIIDFTSLDYI